MLAVAERTAEEARKRQTGSESGMGAKITYGALVRNGEFGKPKSWKRDESHCVSAGCRVRDIADNLICELTRDETACGRTLKTE